MTILGLFPLLFPRVLGYWGPCVEFEWYPTIHVYLLVEDPP